MVISEQKDVRNSAKAFAAAQNSGISVYGACQYNTLPNTLKVCY
jgi:hypothetical protein